VNLRVTRKSGAARLEAAAQIDGEFQQISEFQFAPAADIREKLLIQFALMTMQSRRKVMREQFSKRIQFASGMN